MPPRNERRRFTMTHISVLLVILVLLGLMIPAIHGPSRGIKTEALNDETQFVTAINAFYTDYGYYPCEKNNGDDSKDYFANGGPDEAKLLNILRANENDASVTKFNPKHTIYLDVPMARDRDHPMSGIGPDGVWYDPWGNPYLVKIDSNYKGTVLNPYSANAGIPKLPDGVIVWSLGPDGKGATSATGNGDRNTGFNRDDVLSWSLTWHLVH